MRAYRTRSNLDEEKRRPKPAPRVGLISFGSRYEGAPLQTTPLHFAIEWPERSGTAPRAAYAQSPRWVKSCPDSPKDRLPLYPRKRTQDGHRAMSEKCQQRKSAVHTWPLADAVRHRRCFRSMLQPQSRRCSNMQHVGRPKPSEAGGVREVPPHLTFDMLCLSSSQEID